MQWLSEAKDIATIVGIGVAVGTLMKGFAEYRRSALLVRVERFSKLKEQFVKDTAIARIRELLETDDQRLEEVPPQEKWQFLMFFEEIALLLKARLITDELAFYNFGYYALRCDRSRFFWTADFPKNEDYWLLFLPFVSRMKDMEKTKAADRARFIAEIRA